MTSNDVKITFVKHENRPERLICDAELEFLEGTLAGLKLVGFCLWGSPDGEVYVTFPSRAFGAGSERRYFDFVRSTDGTPAAAKAIKVTILAAFRAQAAEQVA